MTNRSAILNKPFALMGIVNVTPDSFFDGGMHFSVEGAVAHALKLRDEGADILDIGGASSRPGAQDVTPREEIQRIVPVIEQVAKSFDGPISVDTTWTETARAALDSGASWVNDISAGRFDPGMTRLIAEKKCTAVLMHSRGTPQTMQHDIHYDNIIKEVCNELLRAAEQFTSAGVDRGKIILDPGIGFAKTIEHNLSILKEMDSIVKLGYPVLVGTSRKSFIGKITGRDVKDRLYGTLATVASCYIRGVRIFRVHDTAQTKDFLEVLSAVEYE